MVLLRSNRGIVDWRPVQWYGMRKLAACRPAVAVQCSVRMRATAEVYCQSVITSPLQQASVGADVKQEVAKEERK